MMVKSSRSQLPEMHQAPPSCHHELSILSGWSDGVILTWYAHTVVARMHWSIEIIMHINYMAIFRLLNCFIVSRVFLRICWVWWNAVI